MDIQKRQAAEDVATVTVMLGATRSMIERVKEDWIKKGAITRAEADEIEKAAWRREGGGRLLDL